MKKIVLGTVVGVFFYAVLYAQMGGGMMGPGQGWGYQGRSSQTQGQGAEIFSENCSSCHAQGGNLIYPELPLRGATQLTDFDTFLAYVRKPTMPDGSPGPMPNFPPEKISDARMKELYHYLVEVLGKPAQRGSRPGDRMGSGQGMGSGMMGKGMMGRGMMGE